MLHEQRTQMDEQQQSLCNEGDTTRLRQQQHPNYRIRNGNRPMVISSFVKTPREIWHSASSPPQCGRSIADYQGGRERYNRLVGDSLRTDSQQDVHDVVTRSLRLLDDLLLSAQTDCDLPKSSKMKN